MTTRTWSGTTGNFTDAGSWSPAGVPVSGDTAVINAGTVALASSPSGVTIQLNETAGEAAATTLALNGVTLDGSVAIVANDMNNYNASSPTISVAGTSTLAGTDSFYGPKTTFTVASGSTLINAGTLNFYSSAPLMNGGGLFENNGLVGIVNPNATSQYSIINDPIAGGGTIALGPNARIEIGSSVQSGQTILLNGGASGNEIVQLDSVGTFQGAINGFSSSDLIAVTNTPYTGFTYTSTGANSGTLNLLNGASTIGSINFNGQYSAASFSLVYNNFGGGLSNLQISTSVVNNQSGGIPTGNGPGTGTSLPVYRFFDTIFGTHLFTQSSAEAQQILATRPDLTQETNNFGAVSQTGDAAAEPVYRFFETTNGTHFYTASQSEFNALTTPGSGDYRADLTYEQTSTIFEDSTQQAGDVPVFRLFDSIHGTQFLTGSTTEYQGLTTPGSGTYRSDLTPEGIAFYAPSGTYHT